MLKEFKNVNIVEPITNHESLLTNIKESYKNSVN